MLYYFAHHILETLTSSEIPVILSHFFQFSLSKLKTCCLNNGKVKGHSEQNILLNLNM